MRSWGRGVTVCVRCWSLLTKPEVTKPPHTLTKPGVSQVGREVEELGEGCDYMRAMLVVASRYITVTSQLLDAAPGMLTYADVC